MKRILTVQDISCIGKCALTVALPVVSAMGVECAVLPTAVLSNHTAFRGFTFHDLTSEIEPICSQWKREGLEFDAIYTGYLGSFEQMRKIETLFDDFATENTLLFVDPVMGDFGKLYSGFTPEFAKEMARLCARAHVIVPNMTEACALLGVDYVEKGYTRAFVQDILRRLADLGAKNTVLTGVSFTEDTVGVMAYNGETDSFFSHYTPKINAACHGTGDLFASCCVGGMMRGMSLQDSLALAADFTAESVRLTVEDAEGRWYGVSFEAALPMLVNRLQNCATRSTIM